MGTHAALGVDELLAGSERGEGGAYREVPPSAEIHRRFVAACGYGAKHLQRVMRVQAVLHDKGLGAPRRSLAAVAARFGYADQAHMTRDFRGITGFTPAALLRDVDPELGRWLSDDLSGADDVSSDPFKTSTAGWRTKDRGDHP